MYFVLIKPSQTAIDTDNTLACIMLFSDSNRFKREHNSVFSTST